jgi:hypothetical protein
MNVNWGGYSQIECTLRLLKLANEERHAYYHLISGSDLPLVNQDALHALFAANIGREFVHFQQGPTSTETIERVALRRLFVEMARVDRRSKIAYVASRLERLNLRVQRRIRPAIATGNGLRLAKGSQWFSITHDLARYVLAERGWIQRTFGRSFAGRTVAESPESQTSMTGGSRCSVTGMSGCRGMLCWRSTQGVRVFWPSWRSWSSGTSCGERRMPSRFPGYGSCVNAYR